MHCTVVYSALLRMSAENLVPQSLLMGEKRTISRCCCNEYICPLCNSIAAGLLFCIYTLIAFINPCSQAVDDFRAGLPITVCAGVLRDKSNLGDQDKTTAAARFWPHCVTKAASNCDPPSRQCWAIQGVCACCQADCPGGRHQGLLQRPSALSLSGTHARPFAIASCQHCNLCVHFCQWQLRATCYL